MNGYTKANEIVGDSNIMDNVTRLYDMIFELKKVKRRLFCNFFLSEEEITDLVSKNSLNYLYYPEKYLNIWIPKKDYIMLFFYIADIDSYEPISTKKKVICELYVTKRDDQNEMIKKKLEEKGFKIYACYHKWMAKSVTHHTHQSIYNAVFDQTKGFLNGISSNFNAYSDHIPTEDEFDEYIKDKKLYALVDEKNRLVGGLVVLVKGGIQTEEYIFVNNGFRREGVASYLHNIWYASLGVDEVKQYIAWIRDDNEASIHLHLKFGYVCQDTYKITMQKGVI